MINKSHIDRSYPAVDEEAVDVDASAGSSVIGSADGRAQGQAQDVHESRDNLLWAAVVHDGGVVVVGIGILETPFAAAVVYRLGVETEVFGSGEGV